MTENEQIAKCPYCGCLCLASRGRVFCSHVGCTYRSGRYSQDNVAIAHHNALCADIAKGRDFADLLMRHLKATTERDEAEQHLATGVKLLGEWRKFILYLPNDPKCISNTDTFLKIPAIDKRLKGGK